MLKRVRPILFIALFTFLGIYWLYPTQGCIERFSARDGEALSKSFKKQIKEAGVPDKANPEDVDNIFSQFSSLVTLEISATEKAAEKVTAAEAVTPAVNTVAPTFTPSTFFIGNKFADAFCKINNGETSNPTALNNKCATLTPENCNATDCCIWANGAKCVAGNAKGPTFINGVSSDADYYSYKYKCYGNCP
jgi:hypothetical protein